MSRSHPNPEQDLAIARASLASGEVHHAARHLAAALASDPLHPEYLDTAEALLLEGPENAAGLLPLEDGAGWFGDVALHAWLLARTGNGTSALSLLLQVAAVKPEVPYLVWARNWLASPDFVRDVEPLSVATAAEQLLRQVDLSTHASLAETVLDVLARLRAVHGDSGPLMMVNARVARAARRFQEALDIALAYEREHPDWMAAVAVANGYRYLGDLPAAVASFRRALERDPKDLSARLDIGDLLWEGGREAEALAAYEEVLAREPEHPWALPSALLLRAQVTGKLDAVQRFLGYVEAHPDNKRAGELRRMLLASGYTPPPQGEPWVDFLPEPTEATINTLRKILEAVAKKEMELHSSSNMKLTLSCLEAPSAIRSVRRELSGLAEGATLSVTVQNIQKPDPRVPWGQGLLARLGLGKKRPVLWRYEGTEASPAVEPPPAEVAEKLGALAAKPFRMESWRAEAASLARELARVTPLELAAVMVHPPPKPEGVREWNWFVAVQLAAALVLAESGAGRELLVDLLHGPMDWVGEAAVVALTERALTHSTEAEVVIKELAVLLQQRPSEGTWCLEYSVVVRMLRLPGLPPDLREWLEGWRGRIESGG
jgi:tetratricopeptide (TPR) repeat protein